MIAPLDRALSSAADVVFYTARALRPTRPARAVVNVPQGVDVAHFER